MKNYQLIQHLAVDASEVYFKFFNVSCWEVHEL